MDDCMTHRVPWGNRARRVDGMVASASDQVCCLEPGLRVSLRDGSDL
jgi:hypothetical protein